MSDERQRGAGEETKGFFDLLRVIRPEGGEETKGFFDFCEHQRKVKGATGRNPI